MTEKQKRNRARFKKVVAEAAKLRAKNPKLTQAEAVKKAWAISYGTKKAVSGYEKTVSKGTKTTVHYTVKPKKKAAKKAAPKKLQQGALFGTGSHKDTRSHNVNIRVVSGIGNIGENFTRINNDINGNPRYVIHFYDLLNTDERLNIPFNKRYEYAIKKAKLIGGKKYHNKSYGGGIVFQSYNIEDTWKKIQELKNKQVRFKY